MILKNIADAFLDMIFPRTCSVCEKSLATHEKHICTSCLIELPKTRYHEIDFNPMEQLFAGKTLIEKASGFFFYEKGNPYSNILHDLKYRNQPQIGRFIAQLYAKELFSKGSFNGIDCIIPIPLHSSKLRKRGYNQSFMIAQGFADIFKVPVFTDVITATRPHDSQTNKGIYERWLNTQGIFKAKSTSKIEGKHVLIVDDVITTGATLLSASLAIADVPGIKISLATIGVARLD